MIPLWWITENAWYWSQGAPPPCSKPFHGKHPSFTPTWLKRDTKALICDLQMPNIYPQVIGWEVCRVITVHWNWVDVVCMGIGENSSWKCFHWNVVFTLFGNSELCECLFVSEHAIIRDSIEVAVVTTALRYLPQLHSFVCEVRVGEMEWNISI